VHATRRVRLFLLFLLLTSSSTLLCMQDFQFHVISGTWSDACPCSIPCPCWSKNQSRAELCVNFHVFKITGGGYNGVKLENNIFVLENSPTAPRQRPAAHTLYVGTTSTAESEAIEQFVKRSLGMSPTRVLRVRINFEERHHTLAVNIPDVLSYKISFERNRPLSSEVEQNLYPWLSNPRQGITTAVIYTPRAGTFVKYSSTNALSGDFRVPVPR
jgi:hypothetical protein